MGRISSAAVVGSVLLLTSCWGINSREGGSARVIGFVVNGVTAERINVFAANGSQNNIKDDADLPSSVWTVVNGDLRRAKPCGAGDATAKNKIEADGCYQLEDLPMGLDYPIFAQKDGFERFMGKLTVPARKRDHPDDPTYAPEANQFIANIRLFPTGFNVDYQFLVEFDGRPVQNATIDCQIHNEVLNPFEASGDDFLFAENTTSAALMVTTDGDGKASVPGANLTLGAKYHCEIMSSDLFEGHAVSGEAEFVAGVDQPNRFVTLTATGPAVADVFAVKSNVDNEAVLGNGAPLTVTFNRPVELVAVTTDCQRATLSEPDTNGNGKTGAMPADVPGNNASEQVRASMSGDGLTLTLNYAAPTTAPDTADFGTSMTYANIYVRAQGAVSQDKWYAIDAAGGCPAITAAGASITTTPLMNEHTGAAQSATVLLF